MRTSRSRQEKSMSVHKIGHSVAESRRVVVDRV